MKVIKESLLLRQVVAAVVDIVRDTAKDGRHGSLSPEKLKSKEDIKGSVCSYNSTGKDRSSKPQDTSGGGELLKTHTGLLEILTH